MLFNSFEFIILFLPLVVVIYYQLNKHANKSSSIFWLILASLFFYGYWKIAYLPILLGSIIFNFFLGKSLSQNTKKSHLRIGVLANLLLLGYFKYTNFFIENLNLSLGFNISEQNIVLPLAISFFTFQQIAFLVDSYYGKLKDYNFGNYSLFVSFFPQLIAGPIVHHDEMMPQFAKAFKGVDFEKTAKGLFIFSIGLFKKVMIADNLSPFVKEGFDISSSLNFLDAWFTSLAYTFQLYFDFSGYTDMAWGAALLLGIQLPQNFNSPYKAASIRDFWRKWHMTLSRFLRDYLYIPLGGNQKGFSRTLINLFVTFLIGGIWHGAAWTFVAWGALHGFALVIERLISKAGIKINKWISIPATFLFVNMAWIFFRALSFNDAWKVLSGMFSGDFSKPEIGSDSEGIKWLIIAFILAFFGKNSNQYLERFKANTVNLLVAFVLLVVAILHLNQLSEFIYFQF
jgi:D-alanyl-lipoteichoic acid acyltransferase DltB (MBOAT superfamily)